MSRFWNLVAGVWDRARAAEQGAIDQVAPTAKGKPVDEVREQLREAMLERRCRIGDDALDHWAGRLSRGETVVIGQAPDA